MTILNNQKAQAERRKPTKSDLNLDFSSFEEETEKENLNQNNSGEPVIVFTQNPYYGENSETNATEEAVTFSKTEKN